MPFGNNVTPRTLPSVDAGMMRRKLTIQQATNTPDGMGGYTVTWSTLVTVYGALTPWKPFQLVAGQQVLENVYVRYITRYQPSTQIKAGMRLVDNDQTGSGGTTYTIISALDPDGTQRQLQMTCEQIAPGT